MSEYLSWNNPRPDPQWQGIRYLEIDAPVQDEPWKPTLTVHLMRPASGISAEDVIVEDPGGARVPGVAVTAPDGSKRVELHFDRPGDPRPHTVRLASGGVDPLHPFFDRATFTFHLQCQRGDCRGKRETGADDPEPALDSLDLRYKDFRGFMRLLSEWVRTSNPDWSDLSPASLERTLIELLAHHGDMLSHYQDRVANEAFLHTASQRHSLRQHATLLGTSVVEGAAARTHLSFQARAPGLIPKGLAVRNRRTQGERAIQFTVTERTLIDPDNNSEHLTIAAWPGARDATVPEGATKLVLWGWRQALAPGMKIAIVQGAFHQIVKIEKIRFLKLRGWAAHPDSALDTADRDVTEIALREPLEVAIRPWDAAERLHLYANLAPASHGVKREIHSPEGGPLLLNRRNSVIVPLSAHAGSEPPPLLLRWLRLPEGPVIYERDDDGASHPDVDVKVDGQQWTRVQHLHESQSFDRHFVVAADNGGFLWLGFGDGVHGRAIEVDRATRRAREAIKVEYRIGEPSDGNCAAGTLNEVVSSHDFNDSTLVKSVTNVVPGTEGWRKDTLDEIRHQLPLSLKHGRMERAVALSDYAAIAHRNNRVSRATARSVRGPFHTVAVLVDAQGEAGLSPGLRQEVSDEIERARMAGREHVVRSAEYVPLRVEMVICAQPGFLRHELRDRVLVELRPGKKNRKAFFHPDNLSFGEDLDAGAVIARVQAVVGVRSVKLTAFCRLRALKPVVEGRIHFEADEVARLDGDDATPENGILRVRVVGLDATDDAGFDVQIAEEVIP